MYSLPILGPHPKLLSSVGSLSLQEPELLIAKELAIEYSTMQYGGARGLLEAPVQ